jgi:hypothetical protein
MQVRMLHARGSYGYPPAFPPRPAEYRSSLGSSPFTASSPPRKVVTDFAAFGTSKTSGVYGTAVQSTPFSLAGNKAAFGSIRTSTQNSIYDDDEEEEEQSDGRQKVTLREDPISLEQVRSGLLHDLLSLKKLLVYDVDVQARRIAMQSAWRSTRG